MNTHQKGDIGLISCCRRAMMKGWKVCLPIAQDTRYDCIIDMGSQLLRIQVKSIESTEDKLVAHTSSVSTLNGDVNVKRYTSSEIDAIVVYDRRTEKCFLIPIKMVDNKHGITLRYMVPKNNQRKKIHFAQDFEF